MSALDEQDDGESRAGSEDYDEDEDMLDDDEDGDEDGDDDDDEIEGDELSRMEIFGHR